MSGLSIGEVGRLAAVPASTIRYYESIGLLLPPGRVGGRRRYDRSIVELLAVIRVAQQAGFSIADIRVLLHGSPAQASAGERWRLIASRRIGEIETTILRARSRRRILDRLLGCACAMIEDCAEQIERAALPEPTITRDGDWLL